jgi:hypothetical protein
MILSKPSTPSAPPTPPLPLAHAALPRIIATLPSIAAAPPRITTAPLLLAPPLLLAAPLLLLVATLTTALAQDTLTLAPPVPFPSAQPPLPAPGPATLTELAARRALETGLPSIAAQIYRQLLADLPPASALNTTPDTAPTIPLLTTATATTTATTTSSSPPAPAAATLATAPRNRLLLALATALIEDDRIAEAETTLQQYAGPSTSALLLRRAMIDARAARPDKARATAATLRPEDLPPADRPWLSFLRGLLAQEARDDRQAAEHYQQAASATGNSAQHAWFLLARIRANLLLAQPTDATIATLRQTLDRYPATRPGHEAASQLAVALDATNRRPEAIALLQTQLQTLAPQETDTRDDWLLLHGIIAGPDDKAGRDTLLKLLTTSANPDKQRAALRLLATANATDTKERTAEFHATLNQLIAAPPPSPILDDLLLHRAQLTLAAPRPKNYDHAEADATRILTEIPGSPLRAAALGIQTAIAWEIGRFRAAADYAIRARAELRSGPAHAQLGLLIAEAYYRAKDYRAAADAYGAALADPPEDVTPGELIFQRVLSEIQAPDNAPPLATAQKILDTHATDLRFDPIHRWQAEWNLARALQAAGETAQAYARINRLLATTPATLANAANTPTASATTPANTTTPAPATPTAAPNTSVLPPELRARMAWLQMRLAYDSANYTAAIDHAETLKTTLATLALDPALRDELTSMALLLEVEVGYALARPGQPAPVDTAALLRKLRADHPQTSAAIRSYIIEADEAARHGRIVEAQGLLRKLADDHKDTPYVSYALYQAATYAENRGQEQYYNQAYRLLEELIQNEQKTTPNAQSDLLFHARLKQGNLARKLNDFARAIQTYRDLVTRYKYPERPEGLIAELALADCYAAYANTDASAAESAATIYERLLDLPTAPLDLRIEAGYKFGLSLIARKDYARLETTWWQMVSDFLLDSTRAARLDTGRYWMSRTLVKLGEILEEQSKNTQATEAYRLIIDKNLPFAAFAQSRITRVSP